MPETDELSPSRCFTLLDKKWVLQVDRYVRRDVKLATDDRVDLFAAFDGKLYEQLADPETLIDVLWAMCGTQHEGVTPEQFGRAFRGNIIEQASEVLQAAIMDFFPDRQRQTLSKALVKGTATVAAVMTALEAELDKPAPAMTLNSDSSNSPGPPAVQTPAG